MAALEEWWDPTRPLRRSTSCPGRLEAGHAETNQPEPRIVADYYIRAPHLPDAGSNTK